MEKLLIFALHINKLSNNAFEKKLNCLLKWNLNLFDIEYLILFYEKKKNFINYFKDI